MTNERFYNLVEQLTIRSEKNPKKYKLQVFSLALFGYFYLYFILLILLSLIGLVVWGIAAGEHLSALLAKFGLAIVALGYLIVKSLWIRFEPPTGKEVSPKKAPELYAKIEQIRKKLNAPTIHHVLLTDDWNAAIVQNPRLGPFGWYKNYLLLGVPLMQGLTEQEVHSVIAHELGHLSNSHGRFGAWIYRTRRSWIRVLERLEAEEHWGTFLFKPFFRRFVPWFDAYSFVMARTQEFEADQSGAEIAGPDQASSALIRLNIKGLFLDQEFWPSVYAAASEQPYPPKDIFSQLKSSLQSPLDMSKMERWLEESLAHETTVEDTHPCLNDRLSSLQIKPDLPSQSFIPASDVYLKSIEEAMMSAFSEAWREQQKEGWNERFNYVQQSKQTLKALQTKAAAEPLSFEELWNRAQLTEELVSEEEALPLYQKIAKEEDVPGAHFAVGRILIDSCEETGVQHLVRAMELDRHAIIPATRILSRFYYGQNGKEEQFEHYYSMFLDESECQQIFDFERAAVRDEDEYTAHSLPKDVVEGVCEKLLLFPEITEARLVRKQVEAYPDEPCYVLAIKVNKVRWDEKAAKKFEEQFIHKISAEIELPGTTLFYLVKWEEVIINGNLKKVDNSVIYKKGEYKDLSAVGT